MILLLIAVTSVLFGLACFGALCIVSSASAQRVQDAEAEAADAKRSADDWQQQVAEWRQTAYEWKGAYEIVLNQAATKADLAKLQREADMLKDASRTATPAQRTARGWDS